MASTAVVGQEQPRGGKQKNGQQAEGGRTRRVLRDIGNLVPAPVVGELQQISRPMTRGFKTQLLANAQKEAEKNNNKNNKNNKKVKEGFKPLTPPLEASLLNSWNVVEFQKPPVPQPQPEIVNGIVSGRDEAHKKDDDKPNPREKVVMAAANPECNNSENNLKKSSKKKPGKSRKTLTSVLTARSEAVVSGYVSSSSSKPKKEMIVDIDVSDIDNELAVVEYVEDIYQFYKITEEDGRVGNYMDSQPEINFKMRAILVDWLIEVHKKFELMPESLYLTVNIMDRYLSMKAVPRKQLQLVGISSMLIACKYEEIWAPEVSDFIAVSDNAYARNQVLKMEKAILGKLEWYLTVPTPYVFLVRYIKASVPRDPEIEHMVFFFAELGLMDYSITIKYSQSKLAASAVYAARCTLNKIPLWDETLKHHTGFSEDQIMDCAKLLVSFHSSAAENKLKAVYRKYSSPEWSSVALFPPSRTLLYQSS